MCTKQLQNFCHGGIFYELHIIFILPHLPHITKVTEGIKDKLGARLPQQ